VIPARVRRLLLSEPRLDPALGWDELVTLLAHLQVGDLPDEDEAQTLAYLEVNLPGAQVGELLAWPGEWFGNRWYEEVALLPEEAAGHLLERCGRDLPGAPEFDPEDE
jgi:hypothetical protein